MNAPELKTISANPSADSCVAELHVEGMTCNNCARKVTNAIQSVAGVQSVMVSVESSRASIRWNSDALGDTKPVITALASAGYEAAVIDPNNHGQTESGRNEWHLNLWLGGFVTGVLMLGEWVFHLAMQSWFQWLSFALAALVQGICGAQFYRGAWRQLKVGSSNMDTLVALGSTTAFGYSVWALLSGAGEHVYFMEAAAIITLISVGHWIEARVSERASSSLKSLMQLAPATARRLVKEMKPRNFLDLRSAPAATEEEVPVAVLKPGDLVALRPGDGVPVDGVVTEGNSAVNEAMLTGESLPAEKVVGAKVFAGTTNLNGRLVMCVTATGEATALAHIITAVQRAQTSRADIQRLGDRVSNVFVPIVVTLALAAGLWWGFAHESALNVFHWLAPYLWAAHPPEGAAAGFIIAAAVLIVACPCAMGLATPAAIMAAANTAARRGMLIRDGVALEKAGLITAIVFDKTGTLTVGEPKVVAVSARDSGSESFSRVANQPNSEISAPIKLAAALARHSTHPVSEAIARCSTEEIALSDWQEVRGAGISANAGSSIVRLGSLRWLRENDVNLVAGERFISDWSVQGATIVGIATGKSLEGLFAVKDTLKPGAAVVVSKLQRQGLKTYLLTGDNAATAASIAKLANIAPENVFSEVRPEQKAEIVKKLQSQGERVAFVGDGINDAPALTQADLGIAVSRASDVARASADIVLLKADIEAVPEALGLARATLRTIKQNLFWAFFYNCVGVPLAALGFMSPVLCAAAMGLSDIIVIGNALRLRRWSFSLR